MIKIEDEQRELPPLIGRPAQRVQHGAPVREPGQRIADCGIAQALDFVL